MPVRTQTRPAATIRSVLITGPAGSGKTRELARHLAKATAAGAEAQAAARRPADRYLLDSISGVTRIGKYADDAASIIGGAHALMMQRADLVESGRASAGDFQPFVVAVDDFDLFMMDARQQAPRQMDDLCMFRDVEQLVAIGEHFGVTVALTAAPGFTPESSPIGLVQHVTVPIPRTWRAAARTSWTWVRAGRSQGFRRSRIHGPR